MTKMRGRLFGFGDVHGCLHALDVLLDTIQPTPDDHLVFVGDLIDKGRDSAGVLERILEFQQKTRITLVRGNHEEMLLAVSEGEGALRYWENCGGVAMLNSYRFGAGIDAIPQHHWDLLHSTVPYCETEEFIFIHANYLPDLPMVEQPEHQLRWALFEPEEMRPHVSGKTCVVGHTEQSSGEIVDLGFAMCIDTACWSYGWLTAIDLTSGRIYQASRWGALRQDGEPTLRGRLPQLQAESTEVELV